MKRVALLSYLISCLWAAVAWGQGAIQQSGPFTQGHVPVEVSDGVVKDSGASNGGVPGATITELNITQSAQQSPSSPFATPFCINDAPLTSANGYRQLCLGANSLGGGLISYDAYAGAAALPLQIEINGTVYPFPGNGAGNVVGPVSSTSGHLVTFNNNLGTLIADAGNIIPWSAQVHQNGGGTCYGASGSKILCWSNQNMDLIADHSTIQTQDASLLTYLTLTGTTTSGDIVGLNWQISSSTYNIRYTVQLGDTLSVIASNLAACINAGSGAHCTITNGFIAALLAFHDTNGFGYKPTASAAGARIAFDQPWAVSGNGVTTFSSGGATETLTLTVGNILDTGPYFATARNVPGRMPVAGDQLGNLNMQGQSAANSGIDTQYAGIFSYVLAADAVNPQGELRIGTSGAASGKTVAPQFLLANGVVFSDNNDANCGYQGRGIVMFCYEQFLYTAHDPGVVWVGNGADLHVEFDQTLPAHQSYIDYRINGVSKYKSGLDVSGNWFLYDSTAAANIVQATTGGTLALGESGKNTNIVGSLSAGGTAGIAACTIAVAGATITIKQGLITAFTGC